MPRKIPRSSSRCGFPLVGPNTVTPTAPVMLCSLPHRLRPASTSSTYTPGLRYSGMVAFLSTDLDFFGSCSTNWAMNRYRSSAACFAHPRHLLAQACSRPPTQRKANVPRESVSTRSFDPCLPAHSDWPARSIGNDPLKYRDGSQSGNSRRSQHYILRPHIIVEGGCSS